MQSKLCPMKFNPPRSLTSVYCEGEKCAWFYEKAGECTVFGIGSIARAVYEIVDTLEEMEAQP